ncbi:MAG: PP2C family protein-serine/threonine phosphatase [Phycisphaerae bacterium]|nr:PP2C family protein-serine/threonine phosphatase [Tepidisphaeraceae bacterium]
MHRLPWQEELAIVDRTMRAISRVSDPEELVQIYWQNIGQLMPIHDFVSVSRRELDRPRYRITRSSRFTEDINPWTQRDRLPLLSGGLLAEIAYANQPVMIEDLPARLAPDDPAHFYLQGYQTLIANPQYDNGESLNMTALLLEPGHDFDYSLIPTIVWQGGLFGRGTQNLVLRNELSRALASLDRELQSVGQIQKSLLPETLPDIPGFELASHYRTSARAGGDYYDFFPISPDPQSEIRNPKSTHRHGVFIADVSGHGTPAAVIMAITHAIAHADPRAHTPPAVLLSTINDRLARSYTHAGTFVTAFYAVLDPAARTLTYARAGHNPPRLARGGRVIPLDQGVAGIPLGIDPDQTYGQATCAIEPGDYLLLYTDGITEAKAPLLPGLAAHNLLGTEALDALLLQSAAAGDSAQACVDRIRAAVARFSEDAPPADDETLIAIRCL